MSTSTIYTNFTRRKNTVLNRNYYFVPCMTLGPTPACHQHSLMRNVFLCFFLRLVAGGCTHLNILFLKTVYLDLNPWPQSAVCRECSLSEPFTQLPAVLEPSAVKVTCKKTSRCSVLRCTIALSITFFQGKLAYKPHDHKRQHSRLIILESSGLWKCSQNICPIVHFNLIEGFR